MKNEGLSVLSEAHSFSSEGGDPCPDSEPPCEEIFETSRRSEAKDDYEGNSTGIHEKRNGRKIKVKNGSQKHSVVSAESAENGIKDSVCYTEELVAGNTCNMARNPVGCRYLQTLLLDQSTTNEMKLAMYRETCSELRPLITDPFGNYFIQRLYESLPTDLQLSIVTDLASHLIPLSKDCFATRFIQKVIELNHNDDAFVDLILLNLLEGAIDLCCSNNGRHVIQSCLQHFGITKCESLYEKITSSCLMLSKHRQGCCTIQCCLDIEKEEGKQELLMEVLRHNLELMQDAYGNYVVQFVIDSFDDSYVQEICKSVVGNVYMLSIQKFSSNVVEKCIIKSCMEIREQYFDEIMKVEISRENAMDTLTLLWMDKFGNYIVQRALSCMPRESAFKLCARILPYIMQVDDSGDKKFKSSTGRRLYSKVQQMFPDLLVLDSEELGLDAGSMKAPAHLINEK